MDVKNFIIGAGQHARVLQDILLNNQASSPTFVVNEQTKIEDVDSILEDLFYGNDEFKKSNLYIGIGFKPGSKARRNIFDKYQKEGFNLPPLAHSSAVISSSVELHSGVQVCAGSIINSSTVVEENALINTSTSVDHDCFIGKNSHIAPGTIICGEVHIGNNVFIGPGSVICRGVRIGSDCIVGAGSVLVKNIKSGSKIIQK